MTKLVGEREISERADALPPRNSPEFGQPLFHIITVTPKTECAMQ
jgi:hypothetical protein